MAMMCIGIGRGDEVICPSFTFVSTANAILRQGASPRFCDIEPHTLNIDLDKIENMITKRTKAIVPVHYAGISCDMDRLMRIAARNGLYVIEDGAQAACARYKNRGLGTIGDIGVLSFHITKNITCGEGGALLTNDGRLAKKAEIIREKGTNRNAFLKGEVDKYTWIDIGSSFIPSDLLAAILLAQLERAREITRKRLEIFEYYYERLKALAHKGAITLPKIPEFSEPNGHIFWFLTDSKNRRNHLIRALNKNGISATFHYVPLHSSPYGKRVLGCKTSDLPVTESVSKRLVRLPLFPGLARKDLDMICDKTIRFIERGDL
jgi:dTDP-4-amino-4,6-dideoxygalactose transaminase